MLILYSALRVIPTELYEAAEIDGAGALRTAVQVAHNPTLDGPPAADIPNAGIRHFLAWQLICLNIICMIIN